MFWSNLLVLLHWCCTNLSKMTHHLKKWVPRVGDNLKSHVGWGHWAQQTVRHLFRKSKGWLVMHSLPSTVRALRDVLNAKAPPNALQSQSGNICHTWGPLLPHSRVTLRTVASSQCQTQPYQVKCLVGVLEAQQHVLQDRQSPLPHNRVQQLGEDLVEEEKKANEKAGWHYNQQEKETAGNKH